MTEKKAEKEWAGTTYGNRWMHRWLIRLLKVTDVRIIYLFTSVFVIPFCLLFNRSGKIIYHFFRKRMGYPLLPSLWKAYRNHCLFGQVVIDRFAMYAGKHFNIDIEGYEHFQFLAKQESSFIQLSSHVGNYEIAGYTLVAEDKPFNALVFGEEKAIVMEQRNEMFTNTNIKMIAVKNDMSHLFEIDHALSEGETVSMPADRIWGSPKHLVISFLGKNARFPAGPFKVATVRSTDVLAVNVMKTSTKTYKIYVTPLTYDKRANRQEQVRQLSMAYVKELERIVKLYPTQWYNYFDFWKDE